MKIYNALTGKKESFRAAQAGQVRMYVCGVTVYDYCHLGHARSAIVFDVICRYLRHKGYKVNYVRNFTDVDDKIINRAAQEGTDWQAVAEQYVRAYYEDMDRLGVLRATVEPRATEHIAGMIKLIRSLFKKGLAYEASGNVYFSVAAFKPYGRLSRRKLKDMLAGARVEVDERKRNPLDFALWKASKPGEPAWESPWGPGRPGWHIECSAMSMRYLGQTFDIHGGGKDLVFPHHENEIAQSEGATGRRFARYWVHNGFVTIDREKMSKSLGNFFTIREIFEKSGYPEGVTAEVLRYFLLSTHYRSPVDFSDQALELAKSGLDHFYILFQRLDEQRADKGKADAQAVKHLKSFESGFEKAMADDFNTAGAIAQLQKLRGEVNRLLSRGISSAAASEIRRTFSAYGGILGLLQLEIEEYTFRKDARIKPEMVDLTVTGQAPRVSLSEDDIERLVEERMQARREKDWGRADRIRRQLDEAGVILEDLPDGTVRVRR